MTRREMTWAFVAAVSNLHLILLFDQIGAAWYFHVCSAVIVFFAVAQIGLNDLKVNPPASAEGRMDAPRGSRPAVGPDSREEDR